MCWCTEVHLFLKCRSKSNGAMNPPPPWPRYTHTIKIDRGSTCMSVSQGCHQSAWFEFPDFFSALFPDFPWPYDTDLMGIAWNPERARKNFAPTTTGFLQKICLEIKDKLWVTSGRSFSLTLDKKYWNSLTFQKVKNFPDFPWWWQPW